MSQERRERQAAREAAANPTPFPWRKAGIVLLIIAAFGAAYYLGVRRKTSRLDAFAQCLSDKKLKMYGAYWCPHCADQKELFGSSFDKAPYIECGVKGQRAETPECKQAGIKNFPTWEFPGGERQEGTLSLKTLSEKSGCSLP